MQQQTMKPCAVCAEPISVIAKKCRHCQEWQSKWARAATSPFMRHGMHILVGLLLIGVFWLGAPQSGSVPKSEDIARARQDLKVTSTQLLYSHSPTGPTIAAIGTIRNDSAEVWQGITYEVQYFNSANVMIDTAGGWQFGELLAPHSESAFKIKSPAERHEEEYASAKVIIISAKRANR